MKKRLLVALAALWLLSGVAYTRAEETPLVETARRVANTYAPSIVNISDVVKITPHSKLPIQLDKKEQTVNAVGTVIDASGLVVTSLTAIDPVRMIGPIKVDIPGAGESTITFTSELHDLKYRLADGTEIPGRIVMKDEELDLAFIAPDQGLDDAAKAKLVALPLTDPAPEAAVVDRIILLGRTDKSLNYTPVLELGRITACISKPRHCYCGGEQLGTPVFNAQGQVLGLLVNNSHPDAMGTSSTQISPSPIILPTAEVSAAAVQARQEAAKPNATTVPSATTEEQK